MGGKEKTRWGLETEMEAIWFSKNSKKKTKRERNEIEKEDSTFHCFSKVVVLEHGFFSSFVSFTFRGMNGVEEETELNATAYKWQSYIFVYL